ncbi:hypothetical protein PAMP_013316 [Pampus punctatissimus]
MEMMILSILGPQLHCEWVLPNYKVALITSAFWAIGSVFEVLLAFLVMPSLGWRWLLGLSVIPAAIFVCFSFWLPESPRFDVLMGKTEKAMATLTRIAKQNGKTLPPGKLIVYKQNDSGHIKDLFTPQYRRTTLLLWFIWTALSIVIFIARAFISGGYQVAFVYTPEVYPTATRALGMGTSSAMSRLGSLITPFVAQVMLRASVYLTLTAYCVCCLLACVASLILPIETLGRSLEESNLDQEAGKQTTNTTDHLNSTTDFSISDQEGKTCKTEDNLSPPRLLKTPQSGKGGSESSER